MAKTIQKLYDGRYKVTSVHPYKISDAAAHGTIMPPGVTTIISKTVAKEALMTWPMKMALEHLRTIEKCEEHHYAIFEEDLIDAAKAYTKKSDYGKSVGSEVHAAIERYLKTGDFDFSELTKAAIKPLESFIKWFDEQSPKILGCERIVFSEQYFYAGTFDALLDFGGEVVLCDIKTTNQSKEAPLGVYPEYFIQLGAYAFALMEEHPDLLIDDLMVINAGKHSKLNTVRASDLGLSVADCERSWLNVLNTHKFLQPLKVKLKEGDNGQTA